VRRFWTYLRLNPDYMRRQFLLLGILFALTAIAGAVVLKPSHQKPDSWANFKKDISKRAKVDVFDDFQGGLDSWESIDNAATWSYDNGGLVIPGKPAVLSPSIPLTDYDFDSVAQVVSKGLGLVFRASGPRRYQVAKLMVAGTGAMPPMVVERYAVIDGQESPHTRVRCPATFQKDTLYQIHLEVRGDSFTLYIAGHLIDTWSDRRTPSGGVGFFCANGDRARVAWVRVLNNNDATGRVCAFAASLF
jgi:hypothetical protein